MSLEGKPLTPRQVQVLEYMVGYIRTHYCPPSIREMCDQFGISSPNGMKTHLKSMRKKGYIVSNGRGLSRSWVPVARDGECPFCGHAEWRASGRPRPAGGVD